MMTIKDAQKIIPARVEAVWDEDTQGYKKVYCPSEDNPLGNWLSEEQYIEMARAKKRRQSCQH